MFIEYDVDNILFSSRKGRWWTAFSGSSATLPMVMTDSGNAISNGYEDFTTKYRAMVNASLVRPAKATIVADSQRSGDTLHFTVQLTNQSGVTLGSGNAATVWAIVYEEFSTAPGTDRLTKRFVRSAVSTAVSPNLANGATASFTIDTPTLSGVNWDNLRWIVLADYRPGGSTGAYDTLQAVSSSSSSSFLLWTK